MEKKRKNKIRKWDEVGGAVEVEEEVLSESPTEDPGAGPSVSRNFMRGIEDMVEQNDNNFDGVINNLPEDKTPAQKTNADVIEEEQEKKSVLKKLQEAVYDVEKPKPVTPCCICNALERF